MKKLSGLLVTGMFILTACSLMSQTSATPVLATPTAQVVEAAVTVYPTPSSLKDSITWDNLRVSMDQLEITQDYMTDYGSSRIPPAGNKFLWVHVRLKNIGQTEMDVPLSEHFSLLYAGTELKPSYGHRQGYVDYTTLGSAIFPNQELDSWLRFDIPTAAELNELRFVFLPESSQVGASYSSPYYPYAEDKTTYVWNCGP